jgi:hypothetical protein
MLFEELVVFCLYGLVTSLAFDLLITEGKYLKFTMFMLVAGAFFGCISGLTWIYLTGGLGLDILALVFTIIVTSFFSLMILLYLPSRLTGHVTHTSKSTAMISSVVLIGLCVLLALTSIPPAGISAMNTEQYVAEDLEWNPNCPACNVLDANDVALYSGTPTNAIPMTMNYGKSSIDSFKMMEDPHEGGYMDFEVGMSIEGTWAKPYLKIAVFSDKDNDGALSVGDVMWADTSYKMITDSSDEKWRSNCIWQDEEPVSSAFVTENMILPIFHANSISVWKDETNIAFTNTPESYMPPYDMLSWERTDSKITLKESVLSFEGISDTSTNVRGRLYCDNAPVGSNFILVQSFDATTSDPYEEGVAPIQSKLIPFQVASLQSIGGIGSEWMLFIGLGVLFLIGILYYTKERF